MSIMTSTEMTTLKLIAQDPTSNLSDVVSLISDELNQSDRKVRLALKSLERKSLIRIDEDIDMIIILSKGSVLVRG